MSVTNKDFLKAFEKAFKAYKKSVAEDDPILTVGHNITETNDLKVLFSVLKIFTNEISLSSIITGHRIHFLLVNNFKIRNQISTLEDIKNICKLYYEMKANPDKLFSNDDKEEYKKIKQSQLYQDLLAAKKSGAQATTAEPKESATAVNTIVNKAAPVTPVAAQKEAEAIHLEMEKKKRKETAQKKIPEKQTQTSVTDLIRSQEEAQLEIIDKELSMKIKMERNMMKDTDKQKILEKEINELEEKKIKHIAKLASAKLAESQAGGSRKSKKRKKKPSKVKRKSKSKQRKNKTKNKTKKKKKRTKKN